MSRTVTPGELAAILDRAAKNVGPALFRATVHTAEVGRARIKGGASGRPGPNVITGAYRNSWQVVSHRMPAGAQSTIATDAPQGRRLEFGFVGADSLGRNYNQPPFPHVQPALPAIEATFRFAIKSAIGEMLT